MYFIQHCFIFRPPGSTVSHDAEIAPRTAATLAFRKCHDNFFRKNFRVAKMFTIIVQPFQKSLNSFCFFTKIFMKDIKSFTKASKLWRWVAQSGRWVAKSGRWVAKLVARMLLWQLKTHSSLLPQLSLNK